MIDWGDGSEQECRTGFGSTKEIVVDHVYAKPGKYTVHFISKNNCMLYLLGNSYYGGYAWTKNKRNEMDNFCYTSTVRKIEIGNRTVNLGMYCFSSFFNLESLSLPRYVDMMSNGVVQNCYNLKFLSFPQTKYTSISQRMFNTCKKLEKVAFRADVTKIYTAVFEGCENLKSITLPDSILSIDSNVWMKCISLKSIRLPDGIIGAVKERMMRYSHCLEEVIFPKSCTEIEGNVLEECYNLRNITIPESVISIGSFAFAYCTGMRHYYLMPQIPPTITLNTFAYIPEECVIHVPRGCLEAYQTADKWLNYADKMVEME